mmetsp:Transcript_28918/g.93210  ORF Transcript_28918/g.93210 Transcript_28918/m.93210 type:complete len:316 (-) Transcript_28918:193-1140(-)
MSPSLTASFSFLLVPSLLSGLVRHAFDRISDHLRVTEVAAGKRSVSAFSPHGLEVLVELVDKGDGGGDVERADLLVAQTVEVLDKSSEGVPVSCHKDLPATLDRWSTNFLPPRQDSSNSVLETLSAWKVLQAFVLWLITRPVWAVRRHGRRRGVVGASPEVHLLTAMLLHSFFLVQSLESSIVALVESPVLVHRDPKEAEVFQYEQASLDGALKKGGEHDVEAKSFALKAVACSLGLVDSSLSEGNIHPSCEAVLLVPLRLPMSNEHQGVVAILIKSIFCRLASHHFLQTLEHASSQSQRSAHFIGYACSGSKES